LNRLPKDVLALMKEEGDKVVLAGGYIRARIAGEKPSDIDMFTKTPERAELYARRLAGDYKRIVETDNAYSVIGKGLTVQFIKKWVYDRPCDVLGSFDFTIARACIWFADKEWHGLCGDSYYVDLAARRLVYCSPKRIEEAGGSMLRVLKFYQRGYRIPLDSLGGVIARVITGIGDFEGLCNQSEDDWKKIVTGLLREVDPQTDPTNVAYLPAQETTDG